jgi:hypothetical protein
LFTKHAAQMSFITSTSHTQKKFEKMLEGAWETFQPSLNVLKPTDVFPLTDNELKNSHSKGVILR